MNSKRLNTVVITNKKRDTAQGIIINNTKIFFLGYYLRTYTATLSASCLCWLHEPTANTQ